MPSSIPDEVRGSLFVQTVGGVFVAAVMFCISLVLIDHQRQAVDANAAVIRELKAAQERQYQTLLREIQRSKEGQHDNTPNGFEKIGPPTKANQ